MSNTSTEDTAPSSACCGPDCCGGTKKQQPAAVVREKYGNTARSGLSTDHDGVRAVAEAFGYSPDELSSIPTEARGD